MAYIVIKTIKGKQYRYLQRTYRRGKKVKTETVYLGPVRRRSSGPQAPGVLIPALPFMIAHDLISGKRVASFKDSLTRPGHFRESPRDMQMAQNKVRELDRLYGIDRSNSAALAKSLSRLSPGLARERLLAEHAIWRQYHMERSSKNRAKSPKDKALARELKDFASRIAAGPRGEGAQTKSVPTAADEASLANRIADWDNWSSQQQAEYNAVTKEGPEGGAAAKGS